MKRFLFIFLLLTLTIACFVACQGEAEGITSVTTDNGGFPIVEVQTGESAPQMEKESTEDSNYMAENTPWIYSPDCGNDRYEKGYYDYEVTMETTVFDEFPEKLEFTITNHTENKFAYFATFVEKLDYFFLPPYEETPRGWRRVPFYEHPSARTALQYSTTLTFFTENYVQLDYEFTPGKYRLVVFVSGGPQYIYFTIVE